MRLGESMVGGGAFGEVVVDVSLAELDGKACCVGTSAPQPRNLWISHFDLELAFLRVIFRFSLTSGRSC